MEVVDKRKAGVAAILAGTAPQLTNAGAVQVQTTSLPPNPNPQAPGVATGVPRGARPPATTGTLPARPLALVSPKPDTTPIAEMNGADIALNAVTESGLVGPSDQAAQIARAAAVGVMQPWTLEEPPPVDPADPMSLRRAMFWALSRESPATVSEWFAGEPELNGVVQRYVLAGGPFDHWPEDAKVEPTKTLGPIGVMKKPKPATELVHERVGGPEFPAKPQEQPAARPRMAETRVEKEKPAADARRWTKLNRATVKQLLEAGHEDEAIAEAVALSLDKIVGARTGHQLPDAATIRAQLAAKGETAAPAPLPSSTQVPTSALAHTPKVVVTRTPAVASGPFDLVALLRLVQRESPNAADPEALSGAVEERRAEVAAWDALTGKAPETREANLEALALAELRENLAAAREEIVTLEEALKCGNEACTERDSRIKGLEQAVFNAQADAMAGKGAPPSKMQVAVDMVKMLDALDAVLADNTLDEDGVIQVLIAKIAEMRKYLYTCP